jgi:acetyltransferase-like isoleucine patch superfamily enzyme
MIVNDHGHNNAVLADNCQHLDLTITLRGDNNHVSIGDAVRIESASIDIGSNCSVSVGSECNFSNIEIFANDHGNICVGKKCVFTGKTHLLCHETGRITIGNKCLIAWGSVITDSDMHPIFDARTGSRINGPENVWIGNHVWLGADVMVLKGARIGNGSVIGARSTVTGTLPGNVVASGSPARVIRTGVVWGHALSETVPEMSTLEKLRADIVDYVRQIRERTATAAQTAQQR